MEIGVVSYLHKKFKKQLSIDPSPSPQQNQQQQQQQNENKKINAETAQKNEEETTVSVSTSSALDKVKSVLSTAENQIAAVQCNNVDNQRTDNNEIVPNQSTKINNLINVDGKRDNEDKNDNDDDCRSSNTISSEIPRQNVNHLANSTSKSSSISTNSSFSINSSRSDGNDCISMPTLDGNHFNTVTSNLKEPNASSNYPKSSSSSFYSKTDDIDQNDQLKTDQNVPSANNLNENLRNLHLNSNPNPTSSTSTNSNNSSVPDRNPNGKYICSYCNMACTKPSVLQKHIRAHTNERPYPCNSCGFSFKTRSNLYKHCRSRTHANRVMGNKAQEGDEGAKETEVERPKDKPYKPRFHSTSLETVEEKNTHLSHRISEIINQNSTIVNARPSYNPFRDSNFIIKPKKVDDEEPLNLTKNRKRSMSEVVTEPIAQKSLIKELLLKNLCVSDMQCPYCKMIFQTVTELELHKLRSCKCKPTTGAKYTRSSSVNVASILTNDKNAFREMPFYQCLSGTIFGRALQETDKSKSYSCEDGLKSGIWFKNNNNMFENDRKSSVKLFGGEVITHATSTVSTSSEQESRIKGETFIRNRETEVGGFQKENCVIKSGLQSGGTVLTNNSNTNKQYDPEMEPLTPQQKLKQKFNFQNISLDLNNVPRNDEHISTPPTPIKFTNNIMDYSQNAVKLLKPNIRQPLVMPRSTTKFVPNIDLQTKKNIDRKKEFDVFPIMNLDYQSKYADILVPRSLEVAPRNSDFSPRTLEVSSSVPFDYRNLNVGKGLPFVPYEYQMEVPADYANEPTDLSPNPVIQYSAMNIQDTAFRNTAPVRPLKLTHKGFDPISKRLEITSRNDEFDSRMQTEALRNANVGSSRAEPQSLNLSAKDHLLAKVLNSVSKNAEYASRPGFGFKTVPSRELERDFGNKLGSLPVRETKTTDTRYDPFISKNLSRLPANAAPEIVPKTSIDNPVEPMDVSSPVKEVWSKPADVGKFPIDLMVNGKIVRYVPGMPGPVQAIDDPVQLPKLNLEESRRKEEKVELTSATTTITSSTSVKCTESVIMKSPKKFARPNSLALKPTNSSLKQHHGLTPTMFNQILISPDTPRVAKKTAQQFLHGNYFSYLGLKSSTKAVYCTLNKTQPFYVTHFKKLSMYSEWRQQDTKVDKNYASGYDSRQKSQRYSMAGKTAADLIIHSSYKFIVSESATKQMDKNNSEGSGDQHKTNVIPGGYESHENYIYIRGRGRGRYVCDQCGIRCKKPSMLKKHIRTHSNDRPYTCSHCNFSFKTKGNLTKHMKSKAHTKNYAASSGSGSSTQQSGTQSSESDTDDSGMDSSDESTTKQEHEAAYGLLSLSQTTSQSISTPLTPSDTHLMTTEEIVAVTKRNYVKNKIMDEKPNNFLPKSSQMDDVPLPAEVEETKEEKNILQFLGKTSANRPLTYPYPNEKVMEVDEISTGKPKCIEQFHVIKKYVPESPPPPPPTQQLKISTSDPSPVVRISEPEVPEARLVEYPVIKLPEVKVNGVAYVGSPENDYARKRKSPVVSEEDDGYSAKRKVYYDEDVMDLSVSAQKTANVDNENENAFLNKGVTSSVIERPQVLVNGTEEMASNENNSSFEYDNSAMETLADIATKQVKLEKNTRAKSVATEFLKLATQNEFYDVSTGGNLINDVNELIVKPEGNKNCTICDKSFNKPSQLRLHMNIHYLERPFRCESCSVSFRTKGHLQKHERSASHHSKLSSSPALTSSEPRPFKCTDCVIAFRIHGHLAKHLRSKMHIMKLECLNKIPFGLYAELERSNSLLTEINTSDGDHCLESLKTLAKKVFINDPNKLNQLEYTATTEHVDVDS